MIIQIHEYNGVIIYIYTYCPVKDPSNPLIYRIRRIFPAKLSIYPKYPSLTLILYPVSILIPHTASLSNPVFPSYYFMYIYIYTLFFIPEDPLQLGRARSLLEDEGFVSFSDLNVNILLNMHQSPEERGVDCYYSTHIKIVYTHGHD